ncbi:MAG: ComF family protein [Alphaproteobacteria bacterium]|nr:ComF family protein [Alphaproteobacteria bacterium]
MILKVMLDLIVPPRCPISGDIVGETGQLSPDIWNQIHFIAAPYCDICGVPFTASLAVDDGTICASCIAEAPEYDSARAAVVYDDLTRQMVLRYKHGDHLYLARAFTPWMERAGYDVISAADYILPVPLHWTRLLKRRYNQAAILAKGLAERQGKIYAPSLLKRVRATSPQGRRRAKDRKSNVKNAFAVADQGKLHGKTILLIDDIMTSGATVNECAKALKGAGADKVHILSVARAVKK